MPNFSFSHKGKKYFLEVKELRTVAEKMSGLMFRKKSPALLFFFKRSCREPIHSFFCVPFVAIWLNGNKVVDVKLVKPWRTYVLPEKEFDKLLEIPENDPNFKKFKNFL